jgi:hypothetical protein
MPKALNINHIAHTKETFWNIKFVIFLGETSINDITDQLKHI